MTRSFVAMVCLAAAPLLAQQKFDSADAAAQALIDSADKHDAARLTAIFGPAGGAILTSGNREQDRSEQTEFSTLAKAKHRLLPDARDPNRVILSIGDADWPFPVPIVKADGKWSFDASESKVEMEARRIGTNELDAIEICAGYVEAQQRYASEARDKDGMLQYAAHMALMPESSVPRGLADATWDGAKKPVKPYHGYYFRILSGQGANARGGAHSYLLKDRLVGGFGLVAWPAEYGVTGIHTFIVNQDGVIYQKDVAPTPGAASLALIRYDPDPSWSLVD